MPSTANQGLNVKRLMPLAVPWMISPSMPSLTLISDEDEQGRHLVQFCGLFGFEDGVARAADAIIVDDGKLVVNAHETSARYQLICLQFDLLGWMRRSPQVSDREVIHESDYDWSCVPGWKRDCEEIDDWLARCQHDWAATRICPNPGVYVVENSDWNVGPDKERFKLEHFLIVGESISIEILARACSWVSKGNVAR
jgi:hypothetical protein